MNYRKKKKKKWKWTDKCQGSFQRIKDLLMSELFLTHFDSKMKSILASDASNVGIGFVILQKRQIRKHKGCCACKLKVNYN